MVNLYILDYSVRMEFLITFLIALAIACLLCWAVNQLGSMLPGPLPRIIQVFVVVIFCIWLLTNIPGLLGHGHFIYN
jgi:hypothetical protein